MKTTDKQFIESRDWPMRPLLPLIKKVSNPDDYDRYGLLHADKGLTVYFANVCDVQQRDDATWDDILGHYFHRTYDTVEALLKEYRVD